MGPCTQSDVCLEPSERPRLRLGNEPLQVRQHLADVVDQSCSSFGVGSLSRKASGVVSHARGRKTKDAASRPERAL
jgi:hypothetical protein